MTSESSITVLRLSGEVDFTRRDEVQTILTCAPGARAFLVDLSDVSYADSTIVSELFRFFNEATASARPVALLIGDPKMRRLIQYSGLAEAFKIFEDRGAALSFLGTSGS